MLWQTYPWQFSDNIYPSCSVKNLNLSVPHICKTGERVITTSYSCKDEMLIHIKLVEYVWHVELLSLLLLLLTDVFMLFITVYPINQIYFLYVYSSSVYMPFTFLFSLLSSSRTISSFKQFNEKKMYTYRDGRFNFLGLFGSRILRVNLLFPSCYRWYARL